MYFPSLTSLGNLCYSITRWSGKRADALWMPTDVVDRFAEHLKAVRNRKKMTQVTLAEKAGIETTYLSDLENGKKEPCLRVLDMLATSLGMTLSELFKGLK
jgi:DNA-binding XRE family transcriptional regulator